MAEPGPPTTSVAPFAMACVVAADPATIEAAGVLVARVVEREHRRGLILRIIVSFGVLVVGVLGFPQGGVAGALLGGVVGGVCALLGWSPFHLLFGVAQRVSLAQACMAEGLDGGAVFDAVRLVLNRRILSYEDAVRQVAARRSLRASRRIGSRLPDDPAVGNTPTMADVTLPVTPAALVAVDGEHRRSIAADLALDLERARRFVLRVVFGGVGVAVALTTVALSVSVFGVGAFLLLVLILGATLGISLTLAAAALTGTAIDVVARLHWRRVARRYGLDENGAEQALEDARLRLLAGDCCHSHDPLLAGRRTG